MKAKPAKPKRSNKTQMGRGQPQIVTFNTIVYVNADIHNQCFVQKELKIIVKILDGCHSAQRNSKLLLTGNVTLCSPEPIHSR